jgi:hypothetical protein
MLLLLSLPKRFRVEQLYLVYQDGVETTEGNLPRRLCVPLPDKALNGVALHLPDT